MLLLLINAITGIALWIEVSSGCRIVVMRDKRSRPEDQVSVTFDPRRLIMPIFISHQRDAAFPAPGMSGVLHLGIDRAVEYVGMCADSGIREFIVFGLDSPEKDSMALKASDPDAPVCAAIRELSSSFPDSRFWGHVTLAHYTDHGGNFCLGKDGQVDWEHTTGRFCEICKVLAESGAGIVLPFLLRQGAISSIRSFLEGNGLLNTEVYSYGAKFRSSFYGPFNRSTGVTEISKGDLQLEPSDKQGALEKIKNDVSEGSKGIVIKPALPYLDIIASAGSVTKLPLVAYMVSGEYMMLKHAGADGIADGRRSMLEAHLSIFRAGADMVITYNALDLLKSGS